MTISAVMPTYGRYNLRFERGDGAWLYDTEGRRYLDFGAGVAVTALGHCHPHMVAALVEQADKNASPRGWWRRPLPIACSSATPGRKPTRRRSRWRGVSISIRRAARSPTVFR